MNVTTVMTVTTVTIVMNVTTVTTVTSVTTVTTVTSVPTVMTMTLDDDGNDCDNHDGPLMDNCRNSVITTHSIN